MTDFLITQITLYPWFTWLLVFFAAMGTGYAAVWAYKVQAAGYAWLGYRRQVWLAKAAVRRQLLENPQWDCAVCRDREALLAEALATEDDPPEYQHDDGPDGGLDWDGPPDDWSPVTTWGPPVLPHHVMPVPPMSPGEFLARVKSAGLLDDDQLPDGPYVPPEEHGMRPLAEVMEAPEQKCANRDCDLFGFLHRPPCRLAPTQPAACYTDPGLETLALYTTGPAMPPQPVREYLHPAIMDDLSSAGFSEHETTDGAVDSMVMRAMTDEVIAQMSDGIIPTSEEGKA